MAAVTVGIPAYNRADLLEKALASVAQQTMSDFEVIVSDNASTEDLVAVVEGFRDPRFRIKRHPVSIGMVGNWRYSLMAGSSPYVAWLHGDDEWEPEHLERAHNALEAHPTAVLHSSTTKYFNDNGEFYHQTLRNYEEVSEPIIFSPAASLPLWLYRMNAQCSAITCRRNFLDRISWGKSGMDYNIDYLIITQLCLAGDWIYDPAPTTRYRVQGNSVATNNVKGRKRMAAHACYIQQQLMELAVREKKFDRAGMLDQIARWDVDHLAGIVTAACSAGMNSEIRSWGKALLERRPDVLTDPRSSRNCQIAGKIGEWYLDIAELINRLRVGWWPREEQLSAWTGE